MFALGVIGVVIGYGLLYTGLMNFSGHKTTLFKSFGYTGTKAPTIDTASFTYQNVADNTYYPNLSGQPATQSQSPVNGTQQA